MIDKILKRINEINNKYNIQFFEVSDREEIEAFYKSTLQAYYEMRVPYEVLIEVKNIWESM